MDELELDEKDLLEELDFLIEYAEKEHQDFIEKLQQNDPAHALGWADNSLKNAATLEILNRYRGWVQKGGTVWTVKLIREIAQEEVRPCDVVGRSTSQISNLMGQIMFQKWYDIAHPSRGIGGSDLKFWGKAVSEAKKKEGKPAR